MSIYKDNIGDCCEDKKINKLTKQIFDAAEKAGFKFTDHHPIDKEGRFITTEGGGHDNRTGTEYVTIRLERRKNKKSTCNPSSIEYSVDS